jgi:hypothetical protein
MKNTLLLSLVLCLSAVIGCGPATVPVTGKIVFDGEPGQNITVLFQGKAVNGLTPEAAVGKTDSAGVFSLSLIHAKKKGAIPGEYTVYLTWNDPNPDTSVDIESPNYKSVNKCPYKIPTRAASGEIMFTVPAEGSKDANFEFDSSKESFAPRGV